MSSAAAALDLTSTTGYLVAHDRGGVIGRVEAVCAMPPSAPDSAIVRAQEMLAAQLTAALTSSQAGTH